MTAEETGVWPDPRSHDEIVAGLQLGRYRGPEGVGVVVAIQLSEENLAAVHEWVDHSKPRQVRGVWEGLTLLPCRYRADRVPVHFGGWIVRSRGGVFAGFSAAEFASRFTAAPADAPLGWDPRAAIARGAAKVARGNGS